MAKVEDWLKSQLAIDIWDKKYRHNNETFEQWLNRVSGGNKDVRKLILDRKFLFAGRILANRGTGNTGTLSNCYVLSVKDSIESIYETAGKMAITYKAGGGVGVDISSLAPKGAKVNNAAKTTSGAVSFIELFTTTTGLIGQAGRRGALMVSIACDHPDIEDFIKLKTDVNKATSANLSIRVTDDFMRAVENDEDWFCAFTRKETKECIHKVFKAKDLFKIFCDANYDYGEPGLLFWDTIEKYNMLNTYPNFKFAGVNPCAEECLPDGGACLLGSINLSEYVKSDMTFDYTMFKNDVATCIRALDDVQVEGLELHPLEIQRKTARDWRQLGLGIMGLGDMLIKMNIRYGSEESLELCDKIGDVLAKTAIETSMQMGEERGSFPMFKEKYTYASEFYKAHMAGVECKAMRNSQLLCIAPTGSISTMLGISGGIEPLYALEYERTTKSLHGGDMTYKVIPDIVQYARDKGLNNGLVCATEIDYKKRINMQSVWQKHIDSSISSTVNLPKDFPKEKIADLYMRAWDAGLKGITVFRDGCKRAGILTTEKTDEVLETDIIGIRRTVRTGCGNLHIVAMFNKNNGNLCELYLNRGSEGGCNSFMVGLSRMVSLSARNGVSLDKIVDQLTSSPSCPSYAVRRAMYKDTAPGNCCPSAVGKALLEMRKDIVGKYSDKVINDVSEEKCPECGAPLIHSNSCKSCQECGWSKCS